MNVKKVTRQLKRKFPGKSIIQNRNSKGIVTEILCETEPALDHPDWSSAVTVLDLSVPHIHKEIKEEYKIIKGTLRLYVEGRCVLFHEHDSYTIKPRQVHCAIGDETWFEVRSKPGWTIGDHILIPLDIPVIVQQLVKAGIEDIYSILKERNLHVDYVAIFSQSEEEYRFFSKEIKRLGKIVEKTRTGYSYKLQQPIDTAAGKIDLIKIRVFDRTRPQRGAPDFRVENYQKFKEKHLRNKKVNLIKRSDYEMLELIGDGILVYFPDKLLSTEIYK